MDRNLTHLAYDLIQPDRFIFKIPTIYQIRVIALLKRTHKVFFKFFSRTEFAAPLFSGFAACY